MTAPEQSAAELAATIRATLRDNGVMRYGKFERDNTYGALAALDSLTSLAERAEAAETELAEWPDRFCEFLDLARAALEGEKT